MKTKNPNEIEKIINQVAKECGLHLIGEGDRIKYFLNNQCTRIRTDQ